jgi:uncharacterized membrane protein YidH (DUF202 family)
VRPRRSAPAKPRQRAQATGQEAAISKVKALPSIPAAGVAGASAASESAGSVTSLLVLVLTLAIFCFAIAAVRWPAVSWRMAHYVTPRQIDLTLLGFILMVAAGFAYVLTRGP